MWPRSTSSLRKNANVVAVSHDDFMSRWKTSNFEAQDVIRHNFNLKSHGYRRVAKGDAKLPRRRSR